jgi:hypothetical protein
MNFIKRMVERAVERQLNRDRVSNEVERIMDSYEGKTTVHRIANGYVVCGVRTAPTYCVDHNAVAEFIVAQTTRNKMGIGTQMDLFDNVAKAGRIMDANSVASALRNGTIGTLDGQVNIINKPDYL